MKKILLLFCGLLSSGMFAQSIQSVNPNTGNLGQTLQVTITGDNTNFSQVSDAYNVSFFNQMQQQLLVNSINLISDTELIAEVTIPTTVSLGLYNLYVYTAGTAASLQNAFNVTTTYNSISGNIRMDVDGNGCDSSDPPAVGVGVVLNDGASETTAFTNGSGDYIFYVPAGNYVVTPQLQSTLYGISPPSVSFGFATENNLAETQDFCLSPIGTHNDLSVSVLPITPARPGFDATYRILYENAGNQVLSGTVTFTYDDARLDLVSATTMPDSQFINSMNWNFSDLLPFERRSIDVTLNVNSPTETPAVNNGAILPFTTTINPILDDETPGNNTVSFNQTVVGSYDPNDKAVTEGAIIDISEVDNYLHYLIRFQNSGTFAAQNVVVEDFLAANLDASTLQMVSASHPYRSTLTSGNKLEFFFDNINLPPESADEPGSHGFVAFKIKPASTVDVGSSIENTASIYFDFNFPIVTNTVATTVAVLRNATFDARPDVLLYPNPAADVLHIESQSSVQTVKIFNQLGQLVKSVSNPAGTLAVGDLKTGTYLVQITSEKGTLTQKLLKY